METPRHQDLDFKTQISGLRINNFAFDVSNGHDRGISGSPFKGKVSIRECLVFAVLIIIMKVTYNIPRTQTLLGFSPLVAQNSVS